MATYEKSINGYIADVPRLWFKRNDGRIFYFDELTQASVTPNIQYTEINAGWSLFPVAYLPGQSTFEMQITSGKFEPDLFVMTNATTFASKSDYQTPHTEVLTVPSSNVVTLAKKPIAGTVSIAGLTQTDNSTLTTGKFMVTEATNNATVTFFAGDVSGDVTISYYYATTAKNAEIDNRSSAIGEAILMYPVYGNSTDDAVDSSIIGKYLVKVYKCRVTSQPGLDGSYKSASTFQFTLSAMDAKRADEATYSMAYIPN